MDDKLEDFLAEGREKFPEAFRAITLFAATVGDRMIERVTRRAWARLSVDPEKTPRCDYGGRASQGEWIYLLVKARLHASEMIDFELGLWWNAPGESDLLAYLRCYEGREELKRLGYDPRKPEVRVTRISGKRYLCCSVGVRSDPLDAIDLLLDEWDHATAQTIPP